MSFWWRNPKLQTAIYLEIQWCLNRMEGVANSNILFILIKHIFLDKHKTLKNMNQIINSHIYFYTILTRSLGFNSAVWMKKKDMFNHLYRHTMTCISIKKTTGFNRSSNKQKSRVIKLLYIFYLFINTKTFSMTC